MLDSLLERFRQGDRLAMSRLLSWVAHGERIEEILTRIGPPARPARVIAFTGSGGVGKSSLVGKMIETIRAQGPTVAVLACDPQSPLSGGALLGDRFRMPSRPDDAGVFIRSLAAGSEQGALAEHLEAMFRVLEVFGFEVILLETVGAGQGDTRVRQLVDTLVLLLQPETGDDLQWEKAGLFEVADVIVMHKADLPGAERALAQVQAALTLAPGLSIPVLSVSSRTGEGLDSLWQELQSLPLRRGQRRDAPELLRLTQQLLATRFAELLGSAEVQEILARWQDHSQSADQSAEKLLAVLAHAWRDQRSEYRPS